MKRKKRMLQFAGIALSICMMVTMTPFIPESIGGSGHADAAAKHTLTRNQAADVVGIAKSCQGMKLSATKAKLKTYGKGLWNEPYAYHWCGWLVANCAKQAGVSSDVIPRFTYADGYSKTNGYEMWARSKGLFRSRSYKPKPGDLALYNGGGHIEIVTSVSSSGYVKTVGGNTGGGSSDDSWKWSVVSKERHNSDPLYGYIEIKYPAVTFNHIFNYNLNGGTGNFSNQNVQTGKELTIRSGKPKKTGYTFKGWAVKRKVSSEWYVSGRGWFTWDDIVKKGYNVRLYPPGEKHTINNSWTSRHPRSHYEFKAQWRPNTFTVRYAPNGGTGAMKDSTHTYGVKKNLTNNQFKRNGYTFSGYWFIQRKSDGKWAYTKNGTDGWYAKDKQPAGYGLKRYGNGGWIAWTTPVNNDVITMYAQWEPTEVEEVEEPITEELMEPTEPVDPTEPEYEEDPTEPEYEEDPTEPTELTDSLDPVDVTDPTDATESTDVTDPADPDPVYDWTSWSEWSTTTPEELTDREVETKTEFRYRDKQTKKSGRDSLSGYTKESTQVKGPSYGRWLPGELKPTTTVTDEKKTVITVETRTVNLSYAWYCKCKKVCWKNSGGVCKYCGGKTNAGKLKIWSTKSLAASGYKKDSDGSYFLPTTISKSSPGKMGEILCMKWGDTHIDSFTTGSKVGGKNTFVWPDGITKLYRNKYMDYINTFSKWGNWTNWSTTQVNPTNTRQVESRTLYRYRDWVEQ